MIIHTSEREMNQRKLKQSCLRAELWTVWYDITNAMRMVRAHLLHILSLDEVLKLQLSKIRRQLKLKTKVHDDHQAIIITSNVLWLREKEVKEETTKVGTPKRLKITWRFQF